MDDKTITRRLRFGLHLGACDLDLSVAAWKSFWSLCTALTARSLPKSIGWLHWKAELGPVYALGCRSPRWTPEVWRALKAVLVRILRHYGRFSHESREAVVGLAFSTFASEPYVDAVAGGSAMWRQGPDVGLGAEGLLGTDEYERRAPANAPAWFANITDVLVRGRTHCPLDEEEEEGGE